MQEQLGISRRRFMKGVAAAGVSTIVGCGILGCNRMRTANRAIKIGFVSSRTGILAAFGDGTEFVIIAGGSSWRSPYGTKLGSYEIASVIGPGGMGEVYRARDVRPGNVLCCAATQHAALLKMGGNEHGESHFWKFRAVRGFSQREWKTFRLRRFAQEIPESPGRGRSGRNSSWQRPW